VKQYGYQLQQTVEIVGIAENNILVLKYIKRYAERI